LLPTAHEGSKVHLTRALPTRYVPPSGFGHPLDGFLPSNPCQLCFAPAALMGFPPSKLSPPERFPSRFRTDEPTYRFPLPVLPPPKRGAGSAAARFLGFDPPRNPFRPTMLLTRRTPVAPLGFHPPRAFERRPWPGFRPTSSHALRGQRRSLIAATGAPESQSADAKPRLRETRQPLQGSCTVAPPTFERRSARAMDSPHAAPYISAGRPTILELTLHPA
jgi:hypothetical protein